MEIKRVGILRGGEGDYYKNSLASGGELISYFLENLSDSWKPIDILIDKDGDWHIGGLPIKPADLINRIDVVWNTSHLSFCNTLNNLSIPNVGNNSSLIFENSRALLNEHIKNTGINMPRHLILPVYQKDFDASPPNAEGRGPIENYASEKAKEVHEKFGAPWIVKSLNQNSEMGVHVAKTFPELINAIQDGVLHNDSILVEELISGKNAFMHTVQDFRGENVYAFPAGNFSSNEKEKLINLAKDLHSHIGASYYLKSNFVLNPKKGIYLTSVEFSPDIKQDSHFSKTCESVGTKHCKVVEHILDLTLNKKI